MQCVIPGHYFHYIIKHLSRCPCICYFLFVSVQINVKVQNIYITARTSGSEETRVPVHVSQYLSLVKKDTLPKNCFGGFVCSSFLWSMRLIWLKLIRTGEPRYRYNKGEPTKTAN